MYHFGLTLRSTVPPPPDRGATALGRAAAIGLLLLVAAATGCLANPQREQSTRLLGDLVVARSALAERPPRLDPACGSVFNVRTRLYGEPGLSADQRVWTALQDAATALAAVCGQATLLEQPTAAPDSFAVVQGRQRWQEGIDREVKVACVGLRDAAVALDQRAPCEP